MSWVLFIRVQFWEGQRYLQQPVKRGATLFLRRYRVNFRPRYVTKYKMVTQLEWKCCPGFRGADCQEGPRDPTKTPRPTPARPRNSLKRPTGNFLPVLGRAWAPLSFPVLFEQQDLRFTLLSSPRSSKNTNICLQYIHVAHKCICRSSSNWKTNFASKRLH